MIHGKTAQWRTIAIAMFISHLSYGQTFPNYGQMLGWDKDDKIVIFHIDDVGMSWESNEGAKQALEYGIATSASMMMPCPWTSDFAHYLKRNQNADVGLHLTHTSEWATYRWGPLGGVSLARELTDSSGNFWSSVPELLDNASPQQIEAEIYTQLRKAQSMGLRPTHLDTHMGVLWSSPANIERYLSVAIKERIPPLLPAGHLDWVGKSLTNSPLKYLRNLAPNEPDSNILLKLRKFGTQLWNAGLPVVDDLHLLSYDWPSHIDKPISDDSLREFKTRKFKELLSSLRPGITVILIHCTDAESHFDHISDSGPTRRGDMLAMKDQSLKKFITEHGIITTTWRELSKRRQAVK